MDAKTKDEKQISDLRSDLEQKEAQIRTMKTLQSDLTANLRTMALRVIQQQQDLSENIEQRKKLSQSCMQNQKQCVQLMNKSTQKSVENQNLSTMVAQKEEELLLLETKRKALREKLIEVSKKYVMSSQGLAESREQHDRLSESCMRANKQCVKHNLAIVKLTEQLKNKTQEDRDKLSEITNLTTQRGAIIAEFKNMALGMMAQKQGLLETAAQRDRAVLYSMQNQQQCVTCHNKAAQEAKDHQKTLETFKAQLIHVSKKYVVCRQGLAESTEQHDRLAQSCMRAEKQCVERSLKIGQLEKKLEQNTQALEGKTLENKTLSEDQHACKTWIILMAKQVTVRQQLLLETIEQRDRVTESLMRTQKKCVQNQNIKEISAKTSKSQQNLPFTNRIGQIMVENLKTWNLLNATQQTELKNMFAPLQTQLNEISERFPTQASLEIYDEALGATLRVIDNVYPVIRNKILENQKVKKKNVKALRDLNEKFTTDLEALVSRCTKGQPNFETIKIFLNRTVAELESKGQKIYETSINRAIETLTSAQPSQAATALKQEDQKENLVAEEVQEDDGNEMEFEAIQMPIHVPQNFEFQAQAMADQITDVDRFYHSIGRFVTNPEDAGNILDPSGVDRYNKTKKNPLAYFGFQAGEEMPTQPSIKSLNHITKIAYEMLMSYYNPNAPERQQWDADMSSVVLRMFVGMVLTSGGDNEAERRILGTVELPTLDPWLFFEGPINPQTYNILRHAVNLVHQSGNVNRMADCALGSVIKTNLTVEGLRNFDKFSNCTNSAPTPQVTEGCVHTFTKSLGESDRNKIKNMFNILVDPESLRERKKPRNRENRENPFVPAGGNEFTNGRKSGLGVTQPSQEHLWKGQTAAMVIQELNRELENSPMSFDSNRQIITEKIANAYKEYVHEFLKNLYEAQHQGNDFNYRDTRDEFDFVRGVYRNATGLNDESNEEAIIENILQNKREQENAKANAAKAQ